MHDNTILIMGFKLGTNRGLEATGGEIKTKMRFGKESGGEGSVPGTPVIRVPLEEGILVRLIWTDLFILMSY